jgi:hypothetical protein
MNVPNENNFLNGTNNTPMLDRSKKGTKINKKHMVNASNEKRFFIDLERMKQQVKTFNKQIDVLKNNISMMEEVENILNGKVIYFKVEPDIKLLKRYNLPIEIVEEIVECHYYEDIDTKEISELQISDQKYKHLNINQLEKLNVFSEHSMPGNKKRIGAKYKVKCLKAKDNIVSRNKRIKNSIDSNKLQIEHNELKKEYEKLKRKINKNTEKNPQFEQTQYQENNQQFAQPQYRETYQNNQQFAQPQYRETYQNNQQFTQPQYQESYQNNQQLEQPQYQNNQPLGQSQYQRNYQNDQRFKQPQYQESYQSDQSQYRKNYKSNQIYRYGKNNQEHIYQEPQHQNIYQDFQYRETHQKPQYEHPNKLIYQNNSHMSYNQDYQYY